MNFLNYYFKYIAFTCMILASIYADVGGTLSIQGTIRDPSGTIVTDGTYTLTISLYENLSGGDPAFTEIIESAYIQNGVFSVELGATSASSADLDDLEFVSTYYIGVTVDDGQEMTPRTKLTVSPYAMAIFASTNVVPNVGNIGLGTLDPSAILHIVDVENNSGEDLLVVDDNSGDNLLTVEDDGSLIIPSSGGFGIGTAAPEAALDISPNVDNLLAMSVENPAGDQSFYVENDGGVYVNKNMYFYGDTTEEEGLIVFPNGETLASNWTEFSTAGVSNNGDAFVNADNDGNGSGAVEVRIDSDAKLAVGNNGSVGIGDNITSSMPLSNSLDVDGSTSFDGILDMNSNQIDNLARASADDHAVRFDQIYPVGSVYMNALNSANPSTLLGVGTWTVIGAARTFVGYDASDSDFNSSMETGGSKTHTLATANLPAHTHSVDPPNTGVSVSISSSGSHNHSYTVRGGTPVDAGNDAQDNSDNSTGGSGGGTTGDGGSHDHGASGSVDIASFNSASNGSGSSVSNLQPYVTVYMWYRTQ